MYKQQKELLNNLGYSDNLNGMGIFSKGVEDWIIDVNSGIFFIYKAGSCDVDAFFEESDFLGVKGFLL